MTTEITCNLSRNSTQAIVFIGVWLTLVVNKYFAVSQCAHACRGFKGPNKIILSVQCIWTLTELWSEMILANHYLVSSVGRTLASLLCRRLSEKTFFSTNFQVVHFLLRNHVTYRYLMNKACREYYTNFIDETNGNQMKLSRPVSLFLLSVMVSSSSHVHMIMTWLMNLANFFVQKIMNINSAIISTSQVMIYLLNPSWMALFLNMNREWGICNYFVVHQEVLSWFQPHYLRNILTNSYLWSREWLKLRLSRTYCSIIC